MNVSMRLQARQTQSLAMTPQLLQSIRLLQYGHLDLRAFLEREAERNPLIVLADRRPAAPSPRGLPQGPGGLENLGGERPSLHAHARAEIAEIFADPVERETAEALLADLDEAGYLRVEVEAFCRATGAEPAFVARILGTMRRHGEPAGLFAGDLAECLSLQLARRGRLDPVIAAVLGHLDLLARRDFAALQRLTGEDEDGLFDILRELRALDPKPGRLFEGEARRTVEPDVLVAREGEAWRVRLNSGTLPRVLLDEDYARGLRTTGANTPDREFLAECRASANWLVRSLDQRARTILAVACEIMRRQEGFLLKGVSGLRPMTMAAVAESVGLHESTVSRVTADKYVQTPRGTFELRFFFTTAIASATGGEAHSAAGVKERIRRLVAAEGPGSVLSDDDIAARLRGEGVDLARRTVAKYREALGIASSVQRRRELNARRLAS